MSFFFNNASILDFLACNKIAVQLWNINLNTSLKSNYDKMKLCFNIKNKFEFDKKIEFILKKKNQSRFKNLILNFNKTFRKFNSMFYLKKNNKYF